MVTAVIEKDDLLTEYSLILRKKDIIEIDMALIYNARAAGIIVVPFAYICAVSV